MRVNLTTTATEYVLDEGMSLVSRTDLKGRITYVNPAFVGVSGFTIDALMGKAHDVVRHPTRRRRPSPVPCRPARAGTTQKHR